MKEVQISDGIVPLGEFKAQAAKLLKRIGESGQPMVITQNGRPAGVLLSPREYDRIQERQRFLESIAAGLADAESGRTMTTMACPMNGKPISGWIACGMTPTMIRMGTASVIAMNSAPAWSPMTAVWGMHHDAPSRSLRNPIPV